MWENIKKNKLLRDVNYQNNRSLNTHDRDFNYVGNQTEIWIDKRKSRGARRRNELKLNEVNWQMN